VACPTISQCTAVGGNGYEVTFDPATPGTPTPAAIDVANGTFGDVFVTGPTAVACPSASRCTAVDGSGNEVTFNPSNGELIGGVTVLVATGVDVGNGMTGMACASMTQCTAVDYEGHQATFDPASPGSPIVTEIAAQRLSTSTELPAISPSPILTPPAWRALRSASAPPSMVLASR
jgi:alpha-galactosidase